MMRRLRLGTLLIAINVGLLLLAVTGAAFGMVRLLRQLADDQALARVEQAGISARNAVGISGRELSSDAHLLAERPTLLRLLQADDVASLTAFLAQFQQTSELDGSAVILDDQVVAQSGAALDWATIGAAHGRDKDYFILSQAAGGPLILGAGAAIPALSGGTVLAADLLDESFSRQISEEIGLPVTILEPRATSASGQLAILRERTLQAGETVTAHLDNPERYLAILPLSAPTGSVAGLIETELSAATIVRAVDQLVRNLLLIVLATAGLAADRKSTRLNSSH